MSLKIALILAIALIVLTSARPESPRYGYPPPPPPPKYNFDWSVQDPVAGNNYGHQETREGDSTSGSYYVLLPDGRLQKVTYRVVGDSGFIAEVSYQGEAAYPQPPKPKPYFA